jgi:hypothetical protein
VGGWFSGCGSEVGLGRFVLEVGFGDGWGMVGQIKVREMRRKRYKSPSPVLDRDRSGFAPSVRRQTGRVGGRPVCHPASVASGLAWPRAAVRWGGVSRVVKTA